MPANRSTRRLGSNRALTPAQRARIAVDAQRTDSGVDEDQIATSGRRAAYIATGNSDHIVSSESHRRRHTGQLIPGVPHRDRRPQGDN